MWQGKYKEPVKSARATAAEGINMNLMSWSKNTPHCVSWKCWDKRSKSKWQNTQRKAAVLHSSVGRQTVIISYLHNLFCEAETYPCVKELHNGFAPLKDLKGGLQGVPNSSLHYAASYITDHSCSAGEEPEAPPFPLNLSICNGFKWQTRTGVPQVGTFSCVVQCPPSSVPLGAGRPWMSAGFQTAAPRGVTSSLGWGTDIHASKRAGSQWCKTPAI